MDLYHANLSPTTDVISQRLLSCLHGPVSALMSVTVSIGALREIKCDLVLDIANKYACKISTSATIFDPAVHHRVGLAERGTSFF